MHQLGAQQVLQGLRRGLADAVALGDDPLHGVAHVLTRDVDRNARPSAGRPTPEAAPAGLGLGDGGHQVDLLAVAPL